jgi:hypothetical protein
VRAATGETPPDGVGPEGPPSTPPSAEPPAAAEPQPTEPPAPAESQPAEPPAPAEPQPAEPQPTESQPTGAEVPARRPLRIFEFDPMVEGRPRREVVLDVRRERLKPGPSGREIEVVDYDGAHGCFYQPVDLEHPDILIQRGLPPSESNPRFHQQMVYAVVMKVLENFERALGRTVSFGRRKLRIFPHAFYGQNAFFHAKTSSLMFGYFRADPERPGPNLPNQTVFTCLSQDIVAHEATHAVVNRLRRFLLEPTNADVLAFHEGFSDIVAIFQHFALEDVLRDTIQQTRTDLRTPTPMVQLARQFGYATGEGTALRGALEKGAPDPALYRTVLEPHERGSILVAAVFDAFFTTYQRRIADLVRISTGGTGMLPQGNLHPDLVDRVAREASATADSILRMCIRAFEYLPPLDVTFGDYLRALVTADFELAPNDPFGQRAAMIDAFRKRGIYPDHVTSLAEESLIWEDRSGDGLPDLPLDALTEVLSGGAQSFSGSAQERAEQWFNRTKKPLEAYARDNAAPLELDPGLQPTLVGVHSQFRVGTDGQLRVEVVLQFEQHLTEDDRLRPDRAGIPVRGGTTVIAAADGAVRYVIAKPIPRPAPNAGADGADDPFQRFLYDRDVRDPHLCWAGLDYLSKRGLNRLGMVGRFNLIR